MIPEPLQEAVDLFRADPRNAQFNTSEDVGGCLPAARRFAVILERLGVPHEVKRYAALPGWRTEVQHVVVAGGLVVDWIAPQFRGPDWPDVRTLEAFESEFGQPQPVCPRCGAAGDLRGDLSMAPLSEHDCPGPDEEAHVRRAQRALEQVPRAVRRQLQRELARASRRGGGPHAESR